MHLGVCGAGFVEPSDEPATHLHDLPPLLVSDRRCEACDLTVLGEIVHEQLLGGHHGVPVMGDHVLEKRTIEVISAEVGLVMHHHRLVTVLDGTIRMPLVEPPQHLLDPAGSCFDDVVP
jgi:hypothetical protein